jgi:hypothetical protein
MTRICRAQIEAHDIAETQVICGQDVSNGSNESESRGNRGGQTNGGLTHSALLTLSRSDPILTWRLPDWTNFSYSTIRQRMHHPARRQPNPFGPHRPTFARLGSMPVDLQELGNAISGDTEGVAQKEFLSQNIQGNNDVTGHPDLEPSAKESRKIQRNHTESHGPVVPHPSHVPWDDQPNTDLSYDNPYYTRAIDNFLWLPRDPFGVLDLDDTVDLRTSLTSDPQSGYLGKRPSILRTASLQPSIPMTSTTSEGSPTHRRQYTGREDIDLPSGIAKRVQSIEKEDDVEYAGRSRPSLFSYRTRSSSNVGVETRSIRKPSVFEGLVPPPFRSFSTRSDNCLPSSAATPAEPPPPRRSVSDNAWFLARPSQADLRSQSDILPLTDRLEVHPRMEPPHPLSGTQHISTHEAIMQEVMVEEETVRDEELKEEQEEARKATMSKQSWWTSWLFSNV